MRPVENAPDDTLPSPHSGHCPPIATVADHTGPAARLLRSKAYSSPFLLMAATRWWPAASLNSSGVSPQSESLTASIRGSCQALLGESVVASSARMAWASGSTVGSVQVPVVT